MAVHTVSRVAPNQPKTPISSYRIPVDLRDAVKAKAAERGETVTDVVIRAFHAYLEDDDTD